MLRPFVKYAILVLILGELTYSFLQHRQMPVDGDFAKIVLPAKHYETVLHDPFALGAVFKGEVYAAPNRFLVHWTMSHYFRTFPLLLQKYVSPVESIYLSIAIAKILLQLFLIWLLAVYISKTVSPSKDNLLLSAFLVIALFQTPGYYHNSLGVIEQSVTYTFFYSFPLGLAFLFFIPFIFPGRWSWNPLLWGVWLLLAVFLPFSGPLVSPVIILGSFVLLLQKWKVLARGKKQAKSEFPAHFYFLILSSLWGIYSLYAGQFNSEGILASKSVLERYVSSPAGLGQLLFEKPGFLLLGLAVGLNSFLLKRRGESTFFTILKWFGLFAILYLLLLPLGGYREYRPLVIRKDTFMPVTLGLFYFFGLTTIIVLRGWKGKYRLGYAFGILSLLALFTVADIAGFDKNACERASLEKISKSKQAPVPLDGNCTVFSWDKLEHPNASRTNAQLFLHWNVTTDLRLYFND